MPSYDKVWDEIYDGGRQQRYPWDMVVSFVFSYAPRDRERSEVKILEVGCGTASNLWFAAREGFQVSGVEGSSTAVEKAKARFAEEGLAGDLRQGDFTKLPFADQSFDMIIDRGALACVGGANLSKALAEIARVATPGAPFLFNPYADIHTSACSGRMTEDGVVVDIEQGTLKGNGQIGFLSRTQVMLLLEKEWDIESVKLLQLTEMAGTLGDIHAEWRVIARRQSS